MLQTPNWPNKECAGWLLIEEENLWRSEEWAAEAFEKHAGAVRHLTVMCALSSVLPLWSFSAVPLSPLFIFKDVKLARVLSFLLRLTSVSTADTHSKDVPFSTRLSVATHLTGLQHRMQP